MSTDFNPGPGWREVSVTEIKSGQQEYLKHNTAETVQVWIREEPVPPLPTVPYTVIRVVWKHNTVHRTTELAFFGGDWIDVDSAAYTPQGLQDSITSFKVLAEPLREDALFGDALRQYTADRETEVEMHVEERVRRETAKAVLDRINEIDEAGEWIAVADELDGDATIQIVGREFGVEL